MQAQSTRTEAATTSAQSLAAIQTLLQASIGCITFLRDLLPSDNFTDSHFTTSDDSPSLLSSSSGSSIDSSRSNNRNVNGFKIMTMTRGYTDEADKLLNYLEYGIFDALQKQYLRSFVFAIYLDEKDPNNIVEAYTFNFHYHKIPGTNTVVPIMSLGDDLDKLSLKEKDPVVQAARRGKAPTLKDVKKSVKTLLKTLIHSTTQMDVLPKRRFAAFKLYYTDETPSEYEPPHFHAGDAKKDKWFFMTHDLDEVPDKWSVGQLDTGHHSVNLSVASIATYLPSSTEHENATFTGTVNGASAPSLTPVQEASIRSEQAAKQAQDAETRNVVWSADASVEGDDADAEGEDDPDYTRGPDGTFVPIGVRNEAGVIGPLPVNLLEEAHFGGSTQPVPTRLDDVNALQQFDSTDIEQTQQFPDTPTPSQNSGHPPTLRGSSPSTSSLPVSGSELFQRNDSLPSSDPASPFTSPAPEEDIDTQMLQDLALANQVMTEDSEMLDMETQVTPVESQDPIQSFADTDDDADAPMEDGVEDMPTPKPAKKAQKKPQVADRGLKCECEIGITDAQCFCEACGRWYHLWCVGFHSDEDARLPDEFVCFDCRVRADLSWELIKVDLYPKMLSKYKDLALFRRAIKVAEMNNPGSVADFAKAVGCDNVLARQLFKRLENEGFIVELSTEIDDIGFPQTRGKAVNGKSKTKGKQPKQRKNVQKTKYAFNRASLKTAEYEAYFNPDPSVENRLLDLPQTKATLKSRQTQTALPPVPDQAHDNDTSMAPPPLPMMMMDDGSQTQDESQAVVHLKRPLSNDGERPKKKIKISLVHGVDLAD
ncbi:HORMA domain-containing protein [Roridomyces roridus]|uniref:HORMA domain-containing protein n=1 Tax=Roridomyces roridus TaxID=1738132 RepID=A0AAD7BXB1_9AGAR|nr:HORMA domain-containing protein [Roridomyces roridus]